MGMPITVEVRTPDAATLIEAAFARFAAIDRRFSPYRADSELTALNEARIAAHAASTELRAVLALAERTRAETDGYFDIRRPDGRLDPCGIVKGWAISAVARALAAAGAADFLVEAGGDMQAQGSPAEGGAWRVGIRHPFDETAIVKTVALAGCGMATSGTSARGQHIWNPHRPGRPIEDVVSLTVIARDVLEADRFATAAFAMGADGILFIEARPGLEAYQIGADGIATQTSGFREYVVS